MGRKNQDAVSALTAPVETDDEARLAKVQAEIAALAWPVLQSAMRDFAGWGKAIGLRMPSAPKHSGGHMALDHRQMIRHVNICTGRIVAHADASNATPLWGHGASGDTWEALRSMMDNFNEWGSEAGLLVPAVPRESSRDLNGDMLTMIRHVHQVTSLMVAIYDAPPARLH